MTAPEPTVRPVDCTGLVGRVHQQLVAERTAQADVWPFTITFDGDTHWVTCDLCGAPAGPVEAGDNLGTVLDHALTHHCEPTP